MTGVTPITVLLVTPHTLLTPVVPPHPTPHTPMSSSTPPNKATKPKVQAAHPKYIAMTRAAITSLKEPLSSSRQALIKLICVNYPVKAAKAPSAVRRALKEGAAKGVFKNAKVAGKVGTEMIASCP